MPAKTFLQLAQDVRRECTDAGSGPATVVGQVGTLGRIVEWTAQSYVEIQGRHESWRWLRSTFSIPTQAGVDAYAYGAATDTLHGGAVTRFLRWWERDSNGYGNILCALAATGEADQQWLTPLSWADFRSIYKRGAQTPGRPANVTIDPQNRLVLGPVPNDIYTITGEYQRSAQLLAADEDVPEMPEQFHELVVYRAMEKHGSSTSAPEVISRGITEGNRMMRALEKNQMPQFGTGRPLV